MGQPDSRCLNVGHFFQYSIIFHLHSWLYIFGISVFRKQIQVSSPIPPHPLNLMSHLVSWRTKALSPARLVLLTPIHLPPVSCVSAVIPDFSRANILSTANRWKRPVQENRLTPSGLCMQSAVGSKLNHTRPRTRTTKIVYAQNAHIYRVYRATYKHAD